MDVDPDGLIVDGGNIWIRSGVRLRVAIEDPPDLPPPLPRPVAEEFLLLGIGEAGLVDIMVAGAAEDEDLPLEIRLVPGPESIP